jgi:hypothetical protein
MIDRVMNKVLVGDGCWMWTSTVAGRYGQIRYKGRQYPAHRFMYEMMIGPIPDGLQLDHLCRNNLCVRPDHLEPVTCRENLRRGENSNRRKTHCPQGHEYTLENTEMNQHSRRCKECRREHRRRRHES